MSIDPAFDMPVRNWSQQGSFIKPVAPPVNGPLDAPLIQLPCINQDWLLLLMGAIDQLRNPSTWNAGSDAGTDLVLSRVTELQEALWGGMDVPCCNVTLRLSDSCVLQFSTDGGTTWTDVTGWSDNFCSCATACTIAPTPPNPQLALTQQHACNIAGFLSNEIIQKTMSAVVAYVGTANEQLLFAHALLNDIGFAFPITAAFGNAAYAFYQDVVGQLLSQVEAARDDPTLWADVTCAIFQAIKNDGYVTASNFAAVGVNLHAMSYSPSWVPNALGNYWGNLGLNNIQSLQNVGALDDVDCSGCANTWCHEWNFLVSDGGWVNFSGAYTSPWVSGSGWQSFNQTTPTTDHVINIIKSLGMAVTINRWAVYVYDADGYTPIPGSSRAIAGSLGGTTQGATTFPNLAYTPYTLLDYSFSNMSVDTLEFAWIGDGHTGVAYVGKIRIYGPGLNPFGADNCTSP